MIFGANAIIEAYVDGCWCDLPCLSIPAAITFGAMPIDHPELGRVYIVPRSFPLRENGLAEAADG